MKFEVNRSDYDRCVAEGACAGLASSVGPGGATMPAVGLSFIDASAYAAWLSISTGETYRLPTDAEWAFAAGSQFHDDAIGTSASDPSRRWIAAYERAAGASVVDPAPRRPGAFGVNQKGLADIDGNVWEWTSTCFVRRARAADGRQTTVESCGVRTVEGAHRAYVSDFMRDARGGACSAGVPPANLGLRLIREPD